MLVTLDLPTATDISDPLTVHFAGWVHGGEHHDRIAAVEIASGTAIVGHTKLLFERPDVNASLHLAPGTRTGFRVLVDAANWIGRTSVRCAVVVRMTDGRELRPVEREIRLSGTDYRQGDWGLLLKRDFPHLVRREHMYNSGPSQDAPSGELIALLRGYLPPAPARVLDVGCGRGPYAEPLQQAGYDWFGVEIKAEDCAVLARKQLPHQRVDGAGLPLPDASFDAAMCIEVLEHVADPWTFVAEVRRVVRRRFIVSVPNAELVTYWRPHLAVPWHLLESDHRNFFSRTSLSALLRPHFRSVEVQTYGEAPLRTAEGAVLGYHLLAIATV